MATLTLEEKANVTLPKTLTDHPSLVGVIRMPWANTAQEEDIYIPVVVKEGKTWKQVRQKVTVATIISGYSRNSTIYNVPKKSILDFYPYTYYVLTDGESDPLIMHPQYLPSVISITGKIALSNQPVERYYVEGYKGDSTGRIYNITNANQMMIPTASNDGISYLNANANTLAQNRKSMITNNVLGAIGGVANTIGGAMVGGIGGALLGGASATANAIRGINDVKSADARQTDLTLTPTSISSYGTPSTRDKFGTGNIRILKYIVGQNVRKKVTAFVDRYGYKYHNYAEINHLSYKGYLKMVEPNVDATIDYSHLNKIIEIFERGVYIE